MQEDRNLWWEMQEPCEAEAPVSVFNLVSFVD